MWSPQGDEWWWIWVFITIIEFAWMGWLHQSQNKISTDIKENPSEVIVVESFGEVVNQMDGDE